MYNQPHASNWHTFSRLIRFCLAIAILLAPIAHLEGVKVVHATEKKAIFGTVITVGALLIAGTLAKNAIDDTIDQVDDAARERLIQARMEIERIIELIEEKYQDNLNLTLESLDRLAAGQFGRAYNLIITINQELQRTIGVVQEAALNVIEQAAQQLRLTIDYLVERTEQLVIVAAESGVWVIDNLWETIISIVALLFLAGVLLIAYSQAGSILQTEKLIPPKRVGILSGIAAFLLIIGLLLLFWPPLRRAIMVRTVPALEQRLDENLTPQIFAVVPDTVSVGQERELTLIGSRLPDEQPEVTVGDVSVPVKIAQERQVVVTLTAEASQLTGAQPITVRYPSISQELESIIELIGQGPDLVISRLEVSPSPSVVGEPSEFIVEISNQGAEVDRVIFELSFGHPDVPIENVDEAIDLAQGDTVEFSFARTYPQPGRWTVIGRILETTPPERGPNLANNITQRSIEVETRPVIPPAVTPPPVPTPIVDPPVCLRKPYLPQCDPFGGPGPGDFP